MKAFAIVAAVAVVAIGVYLFGFRGYNPASKLDRQAWEYRSLMDQLGSGAPGLPAGSSLSPAERRRLVDLADRERVVERAGELWLPD